MQANVQNIFAYRTELSQYLYVSGSAEFLVIVAVQSLPNPTNTTGRLDFGAYMPTPVVCSGKFPHCSKFLLFIFLGMDVPLSHNLLDRFLAELAILEEWGKKESPLSSFYEEEAIFSSIFLA